MGDMARAGPTEAVMSNSERSTAIAHLSKWRGPFAALRSMLVAWLIITFMKWLSLVSSIAYMAEPKIFDVAPH
jgi:hypothetical protein